MIRRTHIRWTTVAVVGVLIAGGFFWMLDDRFTPPVPVQHSRDTSARPTLSDTLVHGVDSGLQSRAARQADIPPPSETAPVPRDTATRPAPSASTGGAGATSPAGRLLIPVAGVRRDQLQNTFDDARSEGRVHDAIDIMSPCGTQVLAATDGRIVKLFTSEKGGITIYQLSPDSTTVYYYAHLSHYADDLIEGHVARRGEVLGYVGDTGNAGPGNCHLHFAIWLVTDPRHIWDGTNINPYPILHGTP
ncbi:MAG: hypothetical protein JWQ98_546 [Chlorobi bacterium]|nr:hypothetical protein [Chlorobiota bacterium]